MQRHQVWARLRQIWMARLSRMLRRLRAVWVPRLRAARRSRRHRAVIALALVVVLVVVVIRWIDSLSGDHSVATTTRQGQQSLPGHFPAEIAIPAIHVRAPVEPLGLRPDGTAEVPPLDRPNLGGWYEHGPAPGASGAAVILGHRDARGKTAVFFYLDRMAPGDTVEVTRVDGTVYVYRIDSVEVFTKAAFPTDRVYASLDHPGLRLVTCAGPFDRERHEYPENLIVFASLAATRSVDR